jgi:hypothetical protein
MDSNKDTIQTRFAHLVETCDSSPTFKAELKELASALREWRHDDGPALALSDLYEANDLLNALRTVSEESANRMGSAEWTLSAEVSRRINQAIAYLDGAIPHPADDPTPNLEGGQNETGEAAATGLQRGQYALLIGDNIDNVVSGIRGIADTLEGPLLEDIEDENVLRLVMALQQLAIRLYDAAYNVPGDTIDKVRVVLEAPDSRVEAMAKRLRDKKLHLWSDPTTPNTFGVSDYFGSMKMSTCSLGEIENHLLAD